MLITICYSVLTWISSRHRNEVGQWIEQHLVNSQIQGTLVLIRDNTCSNKGLDNERSASAASFYAADSGWSTESSQCSSAISTPKHETPNNYNISKIKKSPSFDGANSLQISTLCYNHAVVQSRRLLWQNEGCRVLLLQPRQLIELHDWTSFKPGPQSLGSAPADKSFRVLLEAEPGVIKRHQYRQFNSFGTLIAWRWFGADLAIILESGVPELLDLMYIFRLGQIILEGGWRVYRLTTIGTEGSVGTLITRPLDLPQSQWNVALTPAELRRLSAIAVSGVTSTTASASNYIYRPLQPQGGGTVIPNTGIFERISNLTNLTPKHGITTISESDEGQDNGRLQNFLERSPRKRSVTVIPTYERTTVPTTPRRRSFCPTILANKSASLVSLLYSKQSSLEEEEKEERFSVGSKGTSKSHESLATLKSGSGSATPAKLLSPAGSMSVSVPVMNDMPTGSASKTMKTTARIGKPPNILILCEDEKRRTEISAVLKNLLSNDRYAVYDIRWDQLGVGGWSEQTALLIVSGNIDEHGLPHLIQFLGDGGRLLAWCCDTPPFGPGKKEDSRKTVLEYGAQSSQPLPVCFPLWKNYQKIIETNDSEGYSRPLTSSVWAKVKGSGEPVVLLLDGGALGGKAMLSQIQFDKTDEGSIGVLSTMLTQHLGVDCSQIKPPIYSPGYLLGDHTQVQNFLSSIPQTLTQGELTVEFVPRGQNVVASHTMFPVHSLECPPNFSTLDYYNNLETKELGRLVIYSDCMTSTTHVLAGQSLRHGLAVIANTQTAGRGRGRNIWLSPEGSALFSVQIIVPLDSQLGRRLSLLQHISALSAILAVPQHKEVKLLVKWPNDIYAGDQKIGGVLAESRIEGNQAVVDIGIGFNVKNAYPTVCLNSLLFPDFQPNIRDKKFWTTERFIARTLTEMEKLMDSFKENNGVGRFQDLYESNWIHGKLNSEDGGDLVNVEVSQGVYVACRIAGIDEYGFLRVADASTGNLFSVQPDGNSFDIANRLIAIKK